jgi:hypothetical protein
MASTAENPVKNVFIRIASQLLVLGLAVASRRAMLEKKMFVPQHVGKRCRSRINCEAFECQPGP